MNAWSALFAVKCQNWFWFSNGNRMSLPGEENIDQLGNRSNNE